MPLSALEISSAIARTSAPITTSRAPTKAAEDQSSDAGDDQDRRGQDAEQEDGAADRDVAGDLLAPALAEDRGRALQRLERAGALDRDHRHREEGDQRPGHADQAGGDLAGDPALVLEQRPSPG